MSSGVNAVYILDGHGSSGLHLAAECGHSNIVDRLLRVRSSDNAISTRSGHLTCPNCQDWDSGIPFYAFYVYGVWREVV